MSTTGENSEIYSQLARRYFYLTQLPEPTVDQLVRLQEILDWVESLCGTVAITNLMTTLLIDVDPTSYPDYDHESWLNSAQNPAVEVFQTYPEIVPTILALIFSPPSYKPVSRNAKTQSQSPNSNHYSPFSDMLIRLFLPDFHRDY